EQSAPPGGGSSLVSLGGALLSAGGSVDAEGSVPKDSVEAGAVDVVDGAVGGVGVTLLAAGGTEGLVVGGAGGVPGSADGGVGLVGVEPLGVTDGLGVGAAVVSVPAVVVVWTVLAGAAGSPHAATRSAPRVDKPNARQRARPRKRNVWRV